MARRPRQIYANHGVKLVTPTLSTISKSMASKVEGGIHPAISKDTGSKVVRGIHPAIGKETEPAFPAVQCGRRRTIYGDSNSYVYNTIFIIYVLSFTLKADPLRDYRERSHMGGCADNQGGDEIIHCS